MKLKSVKSTAILTVCTLGLAACGSSQAPWSKPDNSPWSEKREASQQAAPADEIIYEPVSTTVTEPEPIIVSDSPASRFDEPAPVEAAPIIEQEPAPVVEQMAEAGSDEDKVMSMPAGSYAVQVYASSTEASMARFQEQTGLNDLHVVKTDRNGTIYYVLVGLYFDKEAAQAAMDDLEQQAGVKPWLRSIAGLQKIVSQ